MIMSNDSLQSLKLKLMIADPDFTPSQAEHYIKKGNLSSENESRLKEWVNYYQSGVGKNISDTYGDPRVDTLEEAAEVEYQKGLEANRESTQAYNVDVEGSFKRSLRNAKEGRIGSDPFDEDEATSFINRVRGAAKRAYKEEYDAEQNMLATRYNTKAGKVKSDTVDLSNVLDVPTSYTEAAARDIGNVAGKAQEYKAGVVSGVLGEESILSKGLDGITSTAEMASAYGGAFSKDIENIISASPWLRKGLKRWNEYSDKKVNPELKETHPFQYGLWEVAEKQWVGNTIADMAEVLDAWYHDPRTLCCFVKNVSAWFHSWGKESFQTLSQEYMAGQRDFSAITQTRKFINYTIAVLRIIKDFLTQDAGFQLMLSIDLGLMMGKTLVAGVAAALMAAQAMWEDTVYYWMSNGLDRWFKGTQIESLKQCFPFEKLLRIIADFLSGPDGLFAYIEKFLNNWLKGFSSNMRYGFNDATKKIMLDVTAIDKLIVILEAIRDSMLSLELCIEADFRETDGDPTDDASLKEPTVGVGVSNFDSLRKIAANQDIIDGDQVGADKVSQIVFPTDNEVRSFITSRLGETEEFADQVIWTANKTDDKNKGTSSNITGGSDRGDLGDLESALGDCARTLNPDSILELSKLMTNWDIKIWA